MNPLALLLFFACATITLQFSISYINTSISSVFTICFTFTIKQLKTRHKKIKIL